jgi:preprotein translocase subunit SecG|tara:strand:+ start:529 stop:852 length:324 start_codon:yes stop_codon:yes gene_type:complete
MMLTFLIGLQIFLAILLVVIILLQNGKGADIGSAFGSGNNNGMLGPIESGTVLTTITWVLVFLFFINTLGISVYQKINLDTELEIFSEPLDVIEESDKILEIDDLPD